jgi:hypothetical protein
VGLTMPFKIIYVQSFFGAIEIDESGKIINTPRHLSKFINSPLSVLEEILKKQKQSFQIKDVEDV